MQTKHVCMRVCAVAISPSQVPELCRNKNMRWQTSGISLADDDSRWSRC